MMRLGAFFIAVCMVLIAVSLGVVLYFAGGVGGAAAAIVALAALTAMALYNAITSRLRDRTDIGDQIADLSRGTADLARQLAEIERRLNGMENRFDKDMNRVRGAADPLAAEVGELGGLVKQLADAVAVHDAELHGRPAVPATTNSAGMVPASAEVAQPAGAKSAGFTGTARFRGIGRESMVATITSAVDADRIDLYLQPIVTLPQRKVRYYEAMSRLRMIDGEVVPAADFIDVAESAGLMPKIDNLLLFRCVQVLCAGCS